MKISFPYMGCVTTYKRICEKLGHEVIMPPKPTQKTIDLGIKYSPEFICFPFKVMLGTYIEVAQAGAKVIISSGGTGPCRAGYYGEIHERILKSLGYDVKVIIFDSLFEDFGAFMSKLDIITNGKNIFSLAKILLFGFTLACRLDEVEKRVKIIRAYEINKGETNKVWSEIIALYDKCQTRKDLKKLRPVAEKMLDDIPVRVVEEKDRVRVGIVGEIYVVMESSSNCEIEQRLNDLGCEVYSAHYISDWIKHNIIPHAINPEQSVKVLKKSDKYSKINCGGHDKENLGWIVDYAERGFDAAIHLMPFACLPELVSRSILPQMSDDLGMPILSLSMDEQMGSANVQTRLEAFVDLTLNKKKEKQNDNNLREAVV